MKKMRERTRRTRVRASLRALLGGFMGTALCATHRVPALARRRKTRSHGGAHVAAKMRDGVTLRADVYREGGGEISVLLCAAVDRETRRVLG